VVGGLGCVGKKTALLQAEASACVSGLANVLFCALAFFIFQFCLYVANCPLCRFFTLGGNVLAVAVRWQSTSLSSFQYLSATDSKRLLPTGRH